MSTVSANLTLIADVQLKFGAACQICVEMASTLKAEGA